MIEAATGTRCQEHNQPHESHGRCVEFVRIYNNASDRYIKSGDASLEFYKYLPEDLKPCRWGEGRWPEPHEGIIGVARTEDDLLDLTVEALARRKIMCAMACALSQTMPFGDTPSGPAQIAKRLRSPQIGDLVVESTALYDYPPGDRHHKGFGILLCVRTEWWDTQEVHDAHVAEERSYYEKHDDLEEYVPDPRPTDTAWYIQYGSNPEAVCRWTNCSFTALPLNFEMARIKY